MVVLILSVVIVMPVLFILVKCRLIVGVITYKSNEMLDFTFDWDCTKIVEE